MVGRVDVEDRRVLADLGVGCDLGDDPPADGLLLGVDGAGLAGVDAERRVAQQPGALGVLEHDPRPDGQVLDRLGLPLGAVVRVRVGGEAGLERVEHDDPSRWAGRRGV